MIGKLRLVFVLTVGKPSCYYSTVSSLLVPSAGQLLYCITLTCLWQFTGLEVLQRMIKGKHSYCMSPNLHYTPNYPLAQFNVAKLETNLEGWTDHLLFLCYFARMQMYWVFLKNTSFILYLTVFTYLCCEQKDHWKDSFLFVLKATAEAHTSSFQCWKKYSKSIYRTFFFF